MIKFLKGLFPKNFKTSVKNHLGVPSLNWSLLNLKAKGFDPSKVVDIGAFHGDWTKDFLEVFPQARILMVEAQEKKETYLKEVVNSYPGVSYAISLLSSHDQREVTFLENETASHIEIVHRSGNEESKTTRLTETLDTLLARKGFEDPVFIKLDVQGHELEVLKGSKKALRSAEICLLEVTLLSLGDSSPLVVEVISFMDENDFQLYDISQFMRRPYDKALFQMDALFVRKNSSLVSEQRWN